MVLVSKYRYLGTAEWCWYGDGLLRVGIPTVKSIQIKKLACCCAWLPLSAVVLSSFSLKNFNPKTCWCRTPFIMKIESSGKSPCIDMAFISVVPSAGCWILRPRSANTSRHQLCQPHSVFPNQQVVHLPRNPPSRRSRAHET